MESEEQEVLQEASKGRQTSRAMEKERKKETTNTVERNVVGRLDSEAFRRRSRYLREIYLDQEKRHLYDWTNLEKKILLLDWYHNPAYYEDWRPLETEDMMNKFYTNMIYNFTQLSMANVGTTVAFVRFIKEYEKIRGSYQCVGMVQRYFRPNSTFYDEFKVGLIWRGEGYKEESEESEFTHCKESDYQCIMEGVEYEVFTLTEDEFEKLSPCENCIKSKVDRRTILMTPKIVFPKPVTSMEVTSASVNGSVDHLVAVRMGERVQVYNITEMISRTLEMVEGWEEVRQKYVKNLEEERRKENKIKLCTGCLLSEEDLSRLDSQKLFLRSFTIEPVLECVGLDEGEAEWNSVVTRRNTTQSGLKFFYTAVEESKKVVPTLLGSVGNRRGCVWNLSEMSTSTGTSNNNNHNHYNNNYNNNNGCNSNNYNNNYNHNNHSYNGNNKTITKEPMLKMEFPENIHPTDMSATLSVVERLEDVSKGKWKVQPKIYTTDDDGNLRLWSLSKGLEVTMKMDVNALLCVDVNKKYPHLVAVGGDSGKLKIYNVHVQGVSSLDRRNTNLGMLTLPSHLPNVVYQYMNWYHPIVKVKWVNDVFVASQHAEPLFIKESTNAATLAIWNVYKDIFNKSDAFISNRYWSQLKEEVNTTCHLASRLVLLYGGHYGTLGGMISSDVEWTPERGLLAISSDTTGQLHWYKPGSWTWTDPDDPMCLARIKSDKQFHENILKIIERGYNNILGTSSYNTQGSSTYRKTRSNFTEYLEVARTTLQEIGQNKQLKNDYKSLPSWSQKTLKLTPDEDKYMKIIHKEVVERERMEHDILDGSVTRNNSEVEENKLNGYLKV